MNDLDRLIGVIVAVAVALGVAGAIMIFAGGKSSVAHGTRTATESPMAVQGLPPPVPPLVFADMSANEARSFNATVPLAGGRVSPASAIRYEGPVADRSVAQTCLTAAVLYEAGDDRIGKQAVAQVVLNRLRHPAFPKSVCGVIFEGSERRTGCQFTFTCDGALARRPDQGAWLRARAIAGAALDGFVYKPVGTATHYHADFVVPYWHASLLKIAQVHTQIFYRWPGRWGSPQVLGGKPQLPEILPPAMLALYNATTEPIGSKEGTADKSVPAAELSIEGVPTSALKGSIVRLQDAASNTYVLQLSPAVPPATYALIGLTVCGGKPLCLMMGWTSQQALPSSLPIPTAGIHTVAFIYRKLPGNFAPQLLWDCSRYPRRNPAECLAPGANQLTAPLP